MRFNVGGANLGGPVTDRNGVWLYVRLVPGHKDLHELEVGESTQFRDDPREGNSEYTITRLSDEEDT